jgi:hypothetical protein
VTGGLGLALITLRRDAGAPMRCSLAVAVALAVAAVFAASEPRCLLGPYAMVDPAVQPLWLAHVREMQPLVTVFADNPLTGLGISAFPAVAVVAVAMLVIKDPLRRDFGFVTASAALLLAVAMTFAAIKGYPYAIWLAMPLVAVMTVRLFALLRLTALVPRFVAGLLLTPMALSAGAISIAQAAGLGGTHDGDGAQRQACFQTARYAVLAKLPPGLVAADIDYGPFLLALTPHAVVAAPYHRLSAGIIDAHRIFASPPDEARRIAARIGANYLALCGQRAPSGLSDAARDASLWGRLRAGDVPDWLAAEPGPADAAFRIYRVRS